MLLFSTVLDIDDSLTKDKFIELIIKWNRESPHSENIISGTNWSGERNIKFGEDNLWLDIEEYRNKNIIAVRYEKVDHDGIIWDTDYIMNFSEMKIAIQLDRSYKADALIMDSDFSAPFFIAMLIEEGYLKDDGKLPVLKEPVYITEENIEVLTDIINKRQEYQLPIVYISKTVFDRDPVNVKVMANKLKGMAHVLVQDSKGLNSKIRQVCNDQNEYHGSIGIYYPHSSMRPRRFLYRNYTGSDSILLNKVLAAVLQYANSQNIDSLYTWQGVNNALLYDKLSRQREERSVAENAKQQAEDEVKQVYDTFDDDIKKYQQQIEDLTKKNESFRCEIQGLRAKLNEADSIPILTFGNEEEFYPGEIKDMVLSVLEDAFNNIETKSRKGDVLRDVIESNDYQHLGEEKKAEVKKLFKGYRKMTASTRQRLSALGFEINEESRHYKLTYFGDPRYYTTLAKTPSDNRGDKNVAGIIIRLML